VISPYVILKYAAGALSFPKHKETDGSPIVSCHSKGPPNPSVANPLHYNQSLAIDILFLFLKFSTITFEAFSIFFIIFEHESL